MKNILLLFTGAAIGSVITWKIIEQKYKDLADEEIKSVIDAFKKDENENNDKKNDNNSVNLDPISNTNSLQLNNDKKQNVKCYNKKIDELKYISNSESNKDPYIISFDDFGTLDNWDTKTWFYWDDNVLTDEFDSPVTEYEPIIGSEALYNFNYETGLVYVRNDRLKCDYEIIKSEKQFNN